MQPGDEDIRAELERVLSADSFKRSERLCLFLRFVVDGALDGKDEHFKEYVLGLEVYRKGAKFDPRVDSTVRVEAARLRSKLREYYTSEGRSNRIRIEIPKGAYAPRFEYAPPPVLRKSRSPLIAWSLGLMTVVLATVLVLVLRPRNESHVLVRPLTTWPGEELQPNLSPDGKQIAMVWSGEDGANYDIYVKPIGEGPRLRLTTDPAWDRSPKWSPDGRLIAFLRRSSEGSAVYVVPAVGGAERLVGKVRTFNEALEWLPDGNSLAVAHLSSDHEPSRIYRLSLTSSERQQLTSPPSQSYGDFQIALSPNGRTLAVVRSTSIPASDIYLMPVTGGEARRLTFDNQVIAGLTWSADGRSIIFSSERGATAGAGSLWRVEIDGSTAVEQVKGAGARASWPSAARRGRLLAYQESYQDTNLWRAPTNGGSSELVHSSTREEAHPNYSPDGSRIAFSSNRSGNWEVWVANSDGTSARQLTSFAGAPASSPRWSPDGRLIAFFHVSEGNADIYTMTPEGSSIRRLTTDRSHEEGASWSKDGSWLYFCSNRSGAFEVWKLSATDPARLIQVTRSGGAWPLESPDGRYLYFSKGPDVWRMPANGGEEIRVHGPVGGVRAWVPDSTGIYFSTRNAEIAHYRVDGARVTTLVAAPETHVPGPIRGLALSPDGRWLLYGRLDRRVSDIMLLEDFH